MTFFGHASRDGVEAGPGSSAGVKRADIANPFGAVVGARQRRKVRVW